MTAALFLIPRDQSTARLIVAYDPSAAIWPQNPTSNRPNPKKRYDLNYVEYYDASENRNT